MTSLIASEGGWQTFTLAGGEWLVLWLSGAAAIPWQLVLFLLPMAIILKTWNQVAALAVTLVILSVILYVVWFRQLSKES